MYYYLPVCSGRSCDHHPKLTCHPYNMCNSSRKLVSWNCFCDTNHHTHRSRLRHRLRQGSVAARLLGFRVWIPPAAWMPVSCGRWELSVSATDRSHVQGSYTECGVFIISKAQRYGSLRPLTSHEKKGSPLTANDEGCNDCCYLTEGHTPTPILILGQTNAPKCRKLQTLNNLSQLGLLPNLVHTQTRQNITKNVTNISMTLGFPRKYES
jgi:hypothetical protein